MNFFSKDFDVRKVLKDPNKPSRSKEVEASKSEEILPSGGKEIQKFGTVDEFERNLCDTDASLVAELQRFEIKAKQEGEKKKLQIRAEREAKLTEICAKAGRTAVESKKQEVEKPTDTASSFITDQVGGPLKRLEECVKQGCRVCIVLRGRIDVNAYIHARIVAFDKHWNMLIRDGDESFQPSVKLRRRTTKQSMHIRPHRYTESECENSRTDTTKTVWRRHLQCSLIRGDDVVQILILSQAATRVDRLGLQQEWTQSHQSESQEPFRIIMDDSDEYDSD